MDPHTRSHSVGLFQSRDLKVNGGSRTLHTPASGLQQMVESNPTVGVGKQKSHCLYFLFVDGDWSTDVLILTCSRANHPMATLSRDFSHMQLTIHFPTHSALKRHVHLISTCFDSDRGLLLIGRSGLFRRGPSHSRVPRCYVSHRPNRLHL